MKVFVTGAGGYVGSILTQELINHGHQVIGMGRSDKSLKAIRDLGAEAVQGSVEDTVLLRKCATESDGVIHLAFSIDDFDFKKALATDRAAINALVDGLAESGPGKPFVLTSGGLLLPGGQISDENTEPERENMFGERAKSEDLVKSLSKEKGVRGSVVRLAPVVHGEGDRFFVIWMMDSAKKEGFIALNGESSRWPAVHRADAAALFRLALEKGKAGSIYHGMAENVAVRDIVGSISSHLNVPVKEMPTEEAQKVTGLMALVQDRDCAASSEKTKAELGWKPIQLALMEDMEKNYF